MSNAPLLPPVADLPNDLAPRLVSLLAQTLEPLGFTPQSKYGLCYSWTRRAETLVQRCGLQFQHSRCWLWHDFRLPPSTTFASWSDFDGWAPAEAAAARRTLEHFQATRRNFEHELIYERRNALDKHSVVNADSAEKAETSYQRERATFEKYVVPLFQRRREALDLLRAYDDGTLAALETNEEFVGMSPLPEASDAELYFGSDAILNVLNLSGLRLQNGQNAEALALFDALADNLLPEPSHVVASNLLWGAELAFGILDAAYSRAAFEVAILGAEVARRRIIADGPGPSATRRPCSPHPTQITKPRSFKRPAFTSPNVDETEVASLLWTARFSDDSSLAAEAIRHLEQLANQAPIVVYEGPNERRLAANEAVPLLNAAKSPQPSPPILPPFDSDCDATPPTSLAAETPKNVDAAISALKNDLRRRLEKVFAQRLEPLGFKGGRSQRWTQKTRSLSRYCRFVFWDRRDLVAVSFGYAPLPCYACWDAAPQDAESQALIARFRKEKPRFGPGWAPPGGVSVFKLSNDFFQTELAWDYLVKDGDLEPLVAEADAFLRAEIVPFFERFRETDDLLREYEAGRLPQTFVFGPNSGANREFVAAQTYFRAGNYAEALARFEAVPESYRRFDSSPPNDQETLLLEVARLGALSVQKIIESRRDAAVPADASLSAPTADSLPAPFASRRSAPAVPEPLATAVRHYPLFRESQVYRLQEFAASSFEPESAAALRGLESGAETLRTLQEKCAQVLEPLGFTRTSPVDWTRESATLRQRFYLEVLPGFHFTFESVYYQKLDFSLWDAAPQDSETQATLARFKTLVEQRFANAEFYESHCGFDYYRHSHRKTNADDAEVLAELLNCADKCFTKTVFPFFERWRESSDVLADPAPCDAQNRFGFVKNDAGQAKFGYAFALFQAGRYTESAKRFDAVAKMKRKPYAWPEYDDADWKALQEAAKIAAANARELAQFGKTRKKK
ncbi:MAG: hypothetical protein IJO06_09585 [Thermoguttaceae bacterium]|nr:hypothetical protein [Thermoguttaceae bacterium]